MANRLKEQQQAMADGRCHFEVPVQVSEGHWERGEWIDPEYDSIVCLKPVTLAVYGMGDNEGYVGYCCDDHLECETHGIEFSRVICIATGQTVR